MDLFPKKNPSPVINLSQNPIHQFLRNLENKLLNIEEMHSLYFRPICIPLRAIQRFEVGCAPVLFLLVLSHAPYRQKHFKYRINWKMLSVKAGHWATPFVYSAWLISLLGRTLISASGFGGLATNPPLFNVMR